MNNKRHFFFTKMWFVFCALYGILIQYIKPTIYSVQII